MAHEPGYYKQLLESLLETDATPWWIKEIDPTPTGAVASFYNLDYQLRLDNNKRLKINRIVLEVASGLIRVYFSPDSTGTVVANKKLEGLDSALIPLFKQVFAPYDIGDVHRTKVSAFVRADGYEAFVTYVSYYLSGQVESAWFEYLANMDYKTKLQAVSSDSDYIRYIDDPDEAMQMAAVIDNPHTIQYIKNPTDAVQIDAIKASPDTLLHIKNPTVLSQPGIKIVIMRYLIERLKINAKYHSSEIVNYLRKHGVQWPDLAVIERSMGPNKIGN
jgi:hypothetical protein